MSDETRAEFDALANRVAELEDKLTKHDERFDNIDRKLDIIIGRLP